MAAQGSGSNPADVQGGASTTALRHEYVHCHRLGNSLYYCLLASLRQYCTELGWAQARSSFRRRDPSPRQTQFDCPSLQLQRPTSTKTRQTLRAPAAVACLDQCLCKRPEASLLLLGTARDQAEGSHGRQRLRSYPGRRGPPRTRSMQRWRWELCSSFRFDESRSQTQSLN